MDFGVQPVALCGHSIGEYVAALISGVFDLSVALGLIVERGMATESLAKGGAMLSIKMEKERVQALLKEYPGVAVAAHNAPKYFMSGSEEMITKMQDDLMSKGLHAVKLHVNRAFRQLYERSGDAPRIILVVADARTTLHSHDIKCHRWLA